MSTSREDQEKRIADLEGIVSSFEVLNPEIVEAVQTFGLDIDEYERILADSMIHEIVTTNRTEYIWGDMGRST